MLPFLSHEKYSFLIYINTNNKKKEENVFRITEIQIKITVIQKNKNIT